MYVNWWACLFSLWQFGLIDDFFPGNGAQGELEAMTIRFQNMEEKVSVIIFGVLLNSFSSVIKLFHGGYEGYLLCPLEPSSCLYGEVAVVALWRFCG